MAVASRMFSIAREEIPVVASELVSTATTRLTTAGESSAAGAIREEALNISTSTSGAGVGVGVGMNPVAVRQMVSTTVKEGGKSTSLYRLSREVSNEKRRINPKPTPLSPTL
jgi:hypothetical protein